MNFELWCPPWPLNITNCPHSSPQLLILPLELHFSSDIPLFLILLYFDLSGTAHPSLLELLTVFSFGPRKRVRYPWQDSISFTTDFLHLIHLAAASSRLCLNSAPKSLRPVLPPFNSPPEVVLKSPFPLRPPSTMATNGNFTQQEQYTATSGAADSNASGNDLPKEEVAWYFVEQYYTTLSKSSEKLHVSLKPQFQHLLLTSNSSSMESAPSLFQDLKVLPPTSLLVDP